MKKFIILLIIIVVFISLFLMIPKKEQMNSSIEGNTAKQPIKIEPNRYVDIQCAMTLESEKFAAEAISPSGKTWFFDDVGCMILWLENKDFKDQATLWVHTEDSNRWIDAKKAFYTLTDSTPMHYGFGAREFKKDGMVDFKTMRLKMIRGENLKNPKIRKKLLGY